MPGTPVASRRLGRAVAAGLLGLLVLLLARMLPLRDAGDTVAPSGEGPGPRQVRPHQEQDPGPPVEPGPDPARPPHGRETPRPPGRSLLTVEVVDASPAGRGRPVPGAEVYLLPQGITGVEDPAACHSHAFTDSGGVGLMRGIAPGHYSLGVRAPGFLPSLRWLDLRPDARAERLQVGLERGVGLSGTVTDALTGEPVRNARVLCETPPDPPGAREWDYPGFGARARVWDIGHADPTTGTFSITGLPPGAVQLTARAAGYVDDRREEMAPRDGVPFRLRPSGRILVEILGWKGDGQDVLRLQVRERTSNRLVGSSATRGPSGVIALSDGVPEGDFRVLVEAEGVGGSGFAEGWVAVRGPGEVVRARLALATPAWIQVEEGPGTEPDAFLATLDPEGAIDLLRPLDPGTRRVMVLPGRHRLRYIDARSFTLPMDCTVEAGETRLLRVDSPGAGVVDIGAGVTGSFAALDASGERRQMVQYRKDRLLHIGDEVAPLPGDRILLEPVGVLRLASLSGEGGHLVVEPGRVHRLGRDP